VFVWDPDSPWVNVKVGSRLGLTVSAEVEDDPLAPGMGGFMVVFHVEADRSLCGGAYPVQFTVTYFNVGLSQATDEDLCRAVREGDVPVDNFSKSKV